MTKRTSSTRPKNDRNDTDDLYKVPRPLSKDNAPRPRRSSVVFRARVELKREYLEALSQIEDLESVIAAYNARGEPSYMPKVREADRAAKAEGRPFGWNEHQQTLVRHAYGARPGAEWPPLPPDDPGRLPVLEDYIRYGELLERLQRKVLEQVGQTTCTHDADLDEVVPGHIRPGSGIFLYGTCLGHEPGRVLFEIAPGDQPWTPMVVDLIVESWSETYVHARLSPDITGLGPHDGKVWIETYLGNDTNSLPLTFVPVYVWWMGCWWKHVMGGLNCSWDGVLLQGETLDDTHFWVDRVTSSHFGDGWSELREPFADGLNMAQGWHIGVSFLESPQ